MSSFPLLHENQRRGSLGNLDSKSSISNLLAWYQLQRYWPSVALVLFLINFFIPFSFKDSIDCYVFSGALNSVISGSIILLTYVNVPNWGRHPSSLILNRALSSCMFGIVIGINSWNVSTGFTSCKIFAGMTQFFMFASECWSVALSIDLVISLRNPFASYKTNTKRYHVFIWTLTTAITTALIANDACSGGSVLGICWLMVSGPLCPCFWSYYFAWILIFYLVSILTVCYSLTLLKRGLKSTYETRLVCVKSTLICIIINFLYISTLALLYILLLAVGSARQNLDISDKGDSPIFYTTCLLGYVFSSRGIFDALAWFAVRPYINTREVDAAEMMIHGSSSSSSSRVDLQDALLIKNTTNPTSNTDNTTSKMSRRGLLSFFLPELSRPADSIDAHDDAVKLLHHHHHHHHSSISSNVNRESTSSSESWSLVDVDVDLSPQLNLALRYEVVHYVTCGIQASINNSGRDGDEGDRRSFLLDDVYPFSDYNSEIYSEIRSLCSIDNSDYIAELMHGSREQLLEGGSGSFMFQSATGKFIVKTIPESEARFLSMILPAYRDHIKANPDSLLVKFLGCHSITLYFAEIFFVVMKNILHSNRIIHERYDIKGSWIDRTARLPTPGETVICRHCNQLYLVGRSSKCPDVVGYHEPNIVLKDNDLTEKIRLRPDDAFKTIEAINRDSDFLCDLGITDYSLLVGINNVTYDVDVSSGANWKKGGGGTNRSSQSGNSSINSSSSVAGRPSCVVFPPNENDEENEEDERVSSLDQPSSLSSSPSDVQRLVKSNLSSSNNEGGVVSDDDNASTTSSDNVSLKNLQQSPSSSSSFPARSVVGPGLYFMGIVDILTTWTLEKQTELVIKCKDSNGLSCLSPLKYKHRFQHHISRIIEHNIFVRQVTGSWKRGERVVGNPEMMLTNEI